MCRNCSVKVELADLELHTNECEKKHRQAEVLENLTVQEDKSIQKELCFYFQSGKCTRHDCNFLHKKLIHIYENSYKVKPCRFKESCTRKEQCLYYHKKVEARTPEDNLTDYLTRLGKPLSHYVIENQNQGQNRQRIQQQTISNRQITTTGIIQQHDTFLQPNRQTV